MNGKGLMSITIEDAIKKIDNDIFCLPVIQRDYVWEPKKIELLFDSIMRDYPIGTFLFWTLNNDILKQFNFYSFCKYGSENKQLADEKKPIASQLKDELIGVLDGQQRLTSLYIGMHSKYNIQRRGHAIDSNKNYTSKELCLDLTSINEYDKEELLNVSKKIYNFEFKTDEEITDDIKWFKVNNFAFKDDEEIKDIVNKIKELYPDKRNIITNNYNLLYKKIKKDKILSGMLIKDKTTSEVLEIFERVNSFGKSLKKTDLLFSSITSEWQGGYEKMNQLLKTINNKPNLVNKFDINYIVLSSLVMIGESPKIKISSLTKKKIEKIYQEWENISNSIIACADLVSNINMYSSSLKSVNALIPISYFHYKHKTRLSRYKRSIRRYLQICVIKKIYGVHADTVLKNMIDAIDNNEITTWELNELRNVVVDGEYAFRVNEKNIDDLLEYEKGDYTLFTLSILYEEMIHINEEEYEQDHMHPRTPFIEEIAINFPKKTDREREQLKKMNNMLPNLQLLTKDENSKKSDTPYTDYITTKKKKDRYLVPTCSYNVKKFEKFYEERKKLIKAKLNKKFKVEVEKKS